MSARVERTVPATKTRAEEVVVDFEAEKVKAPFLLRCGALLIDYIFLISVPVISMLVGRLYGYDGAKLLNNELNNAGWLIMVILLVSNFVIFPLFHGQSLGKMMTGIRIVKADGKMPSLVSLLVRHLIGYPLTALTGGLGFLLSVFTPTGRALHDYLAGTVVIFARKTERK